MQWRLLKALLLSLSRDDVCTVRRVHPRSKGVLFSPLLGLLDLCDGLLFAFLIVQLTSADLVQRMTNSKRNFDYLTTGDIDHSLFLPDLAATLPNSKNFINEVLSTTEYANYMSLNEAVNKNGFKFVWYSAGRVLVRRSETKRVHAVSTVSDLAVILSSPGVAFPLTEPVEGKHLFHRSPLRGATCGARGR